MTHGTLIEFSFSSSEQNLALTVKLPRIHVIVVGRFHFVFLSIYSSFLGTDSPNCIDCKTATPHELRHMRIGLKARLRSIPANPLQPLSPLGAP